MPEPAELRRRGVLPPGTRVGRYELVRRLARGGMAELYLARASGPHGFEKLCVVKLALPHLTEDRQFVEMFLHEARLAARLEHANIAHVSDIGEFGTEPFFVMQFIRGRDVRSVLAARKGKLVPLDVALTIVAQAAAGLHYAHEQRDESGKPLGMIHRDVSPSNIMIGFDGGIKIVDFGIAKSSLQNANTRTGVLKGKVSYMAPEQCRSGDLDRRTDIFGLGILLYELCTARPLFRGDSDFDIMSRIVNGVYKPPSEYIPGFPPELEAVIDRALQVDPDDRFPTAEAMWSELETFAADNGLGLSTLTVRRFMADTFGPQSDNGEDDPEPRDEGRAGQVPFLGGTDDSADEAGGREAASTVAFPAPMTEVAPAPRTVVAGRTLASKAEAEPKSSRPTPKPKPVRVNVPKARGPAQTQVARLQAPKPRPEQRQGAKASSAARPRGMAPWLKVVLGVVAGLMLWWTAWFVFLREPAAPAPVPPGPQVNQEPASEARPVEPTPSVASSEPSPSTLSEEEIRGLSFQQRHAWLAEPGRADVDIELHIGLDLVQAEQSNAPCRTFSDALSTIGSQELAPYAWALEQAHVPGSPDPLPECRGLQERLDQLRDRLAPQPKTRERGRRGRRRRPAAGAVTPPTPTPAPDPEPSSTDDRPKRGVASKLDD